MSPRRRRREAAKRDGSVEQGEPTADGAEQDEPSQLGMWEEAGIKEIGVLDADGDRWSVFVLVESVADDLAHGKLSFRLGDARHDTVAVLVEESAAAVARRASELPPSMLRQFLQSARR